MLLDASSADHSSGIVDRRALELLVSRMPNAETFALISVSMTTDLPAESDAYRELHRVAAARLQHLTRGSDAAGVWDDITFVVLCPGATAAAAAIIETRIRAALNSRVRVDGGFDAITADVGRTVSPGRGVLADVVAAAVDGASPLRTHPTVAVVPPSPTDDEPAPERPLRTRASIYLGDLDPEHARRMLDAGIVTDDLELRTICVDLDRFQPTGSW